MSDVMMRSGQGGRPDDALAPPYGRFIGPAVAVVLCLGYVMVRPASEDYASGHFRASLFRDGAHVWNNLWFGGHPLPAYGIISSGLGALFGVVPVAILATLIATWCFARLVFDSDVRSWSNPAVAVALFAGGCGANLWAGRLTFGPAVMFGTVSLLLVQRQRTLGSMVAAALCGLSSPVGALSLVVVLTAGWLARSAPRRLLAAAGVSALLPIGLVARAFPERGWFPYTWGSLGLLALALAGMAWCGRSIPAVRWLAVVYGAVAVAAFVTRSALGGNVVRLGWLAAGPVAALTIRSHRRIAVAVIAVISTAWNWAYVPMAFEPAAATMQDVAFGPLASYVNGIGRPVRIEVVPTKTFGEADALALKTSGIARGWETQLDRQLNPDFYGDGITVSSFHRWLLDRAVSLVALPARGLAPRSTAEADVIRSAPSYLRKTWSNADWSVFEVVDATPLADHGATVTEVSPEALTIEAASAGATVVKFRYTALYQVAEGDACILKTPDGWIGLLVRRPGQIRLTIEVANSIRPDEPSHCD